jgi:hypothetical protein
VVEEQGSAIPTLAKGRYVNVKKRDACRYGFNYIYIASLSIYCKSNCSSGVFWSVTNKNNKTFTYRLLSFYLNRVDLIPELGFNLLYRKTTLYS